MSKSRAGDSAAYHAFRFMSQVFRKMPARTVVGVGRFFGERAAAFSRKRVSVAYADMKAVFGSRFSEKELFRRIQRQYGYLGELFAELMCFPNMTKESMGRVIKIHHTERYLSTLAEDKGVIVITGHFGNWELLQFVSNVYYDHPVHLIAAAQKHSRVNDFLNSLRSCQGSVVITRSKGMGLIRVFKALKKKKVAGVLCDQDAGKTGGMILPFLGRKTTIQTGPFELALKTGSPLFPCFLVRANGPEHELFMEHPIWMDPTGNPEEEIKKGAVKFLELLEGMIHRFPDQWLWGVKRWKYSWTKRLLILSTGNPDQAKPSEAIAKRFQEIQTQYNRAGMEYPVKTIQVKFKSRFHQKMFMIFSLFFIPRAQGKLRRLSFFFMPETQKEILESSADFIISSAPELVPLNLCLAKDSRAKSIVITKPLFPFNLFRYDLAAADESDILPAHLQKIL